MDFHLTAKGAEFYDEKSGGDGKRIAEPIEITIKINMSKRHYIAVIDKLVNAIVKAIKI